MIIQANFSPTGLPKGTDIAQLTSHVTASVTSMVNRCGLDPETAAGLNKPKAGDSTFKGFN